MYWFLFHIVNKHYLVKKQEEKTDKNKQKLTVLDDVKNKFHHFKNDSSWYISLMFWDDLKIKSWRRGKMNGVKEKENEIMYYYWVSLCDVTLG